MFGHIAFVAAAITSTAVGQLPLNTPLPALKVVPDGDIRVCAFAPDRLYVAGDFTTIGVLTGGFALLDPETGQPQVGLPVTDGDVRVVAPDGEGGWYVGGDFAVVGGEPRSNIAHIDADGVLTDWAPTVGGEVFSLAVNDAAVYVGGIFGVVSGQPRNNLAAINRQTGNPTLFDPDVNGIVLDLAVVDGVVYAAGGFSTVGGEPRAGLAAVENFLGIVQDFNPATFGSLSAMAVDGDTMYVAGLVSFDEGPEVRHIVSIDLGTGMPDGVVDVTYSFQNTGSVRDIAISPDRIYVGGRFNMLGPTTRDHVGAIDRATGAIVIWGPSFDQPGHFQNPPDIEALAVLDDTVYVAGNFHFANGEERVNIAAFGTDIGAPLLPFTITPGGRREAWSVEASGDEIAFGGRFLLLGEPAPGLAAYDPATGERIPWITHWPDEEAIEISNLALDWHDGLVLVGGADTHVTRYTRYTYALDEFDGSIVHDFSLVNDQRQRGHNAYARQSFAVYQDTVVMLMTKGDAEQGIVAGFNLTTGDLMWETAFTGILTCIEPAPVEGAMLLGGLIDSLGGEVAEEPQGLASINATSGLPLMWDLPVNDEVSAIEVIGDHVYLAGAFTSLGGLVRDRLAGVDLSDFLNPSVTNWEPDPDADVDTILHVGETLVVGGGFNLVGGDVRPNLGAVKPDFGFASAWEPGASESPSSVAFNQELLAVTVSDQATFNDEARPHIAVFTTGLCEADINGDCLLNILDFVAFQNAFEAEDPVADCDGNGSFNILDFVCYQNQFTLGCP